MTQIQQLGFFANNITVNTAANSVSVSSSINATAHTVGTTFIANTTQLTITTPFSANGGVGTSGQVLTSGGTGANAYWSTVSAGGGGGFSNGQSISVANLAITGSVTANGSVGTSGQALVSTGTGVQWGALSPGYNYSAQFNGSTQYLTVASASSWLPSSTGDWTIEAWVYLTGYSISYTGAYQGTIASAVTTNNSTSGWYFNIGGTASSWTGVSMTFFTSSVASTVSATYTFNLNTWYHVAVSKNGTTVRVFVNGVIVASGTPTFNDGVPTLRIGGLDNTSYLYSLPGFISNFRIVKGTAVYTANFTTPTSPLSAISGTAILTCSAITLTDQSTNLVTITNNASGVTTTATLSPFTSTTVSIPTSSLTSVRQQFTGDGSTTQFNVAGGYTANAISVFVNGVLARNGTDVTVTSGSYITFTGITPPNGSLIDVIGTVPTTYSSITPVSYSVGFNGSQTLTVPTSTTFGYGTGDFTIEFWAYFNSVATNTIVSNLQTTAGIQPHLYLTAGAALAYYTNGVVSITGSVVTTGVWYHIALVRIGGSTKIYLNGTQTGSTYTDTNNYGTTNPLVVGDYYTSGSTLSGANRLNGYISNLRVVKGVGVYTNAFTPPTSPLAAVQSTGPNVAAITGTQTSLLTCNGPTIIDGSTNAFTITNNGSAPVSTAIVPTFTNVTINSGSGSGSGSSVSWQSVQTSSFTATSGYAYPINTTGGAITVTLPASPTAGNIVQLTDYAGTWNSYYLTINPNGSKINSGTTNVVATNSRETISLVYIDSIQGWLAYSGFNTSTPGAPYSITYLAIAGGGGGGYDCAGGGGAGGFLTNTTGLIQGTTYTIVVGAGGAGGSSTVAIGAYQGVNSSITSTNLTVNAIGGGGGSGDYSPSSQNGGSGGGGNGGGGAGGSGTSGQGTAGGTGGTLLGGGGGGAGVIGTSAVNGVTAGAGGAGLASSITGSSVTYAGGGGGGSYSSYGGAGAGGAGGGGSGTGTGGTGVAGTINTGGGGGGGGGGSGRGPGGNGGSGVVILSVPTVAYTANVTGSPTVTTSGTNTILKYTSSGTYTA